MCFRVEVFEDDKDTGPPLSISVARTTPLGNGVLIPILLPLPKHAFRTLLWELAVGACNKKKLKISVCSY